MSQKSSGNLAEQIAANLGERIICGELTSGTPIREQAVTADLQVSRGSVREALLILQRQQLVDIFPRRGAQVKQLTTENVGALYEFSSMLYTQLGTFTAQRWQTESQLMVFVDVRRQLEHSMQQRNLRGFIEHSFAILRAAGPIAGNPFLMQAIENLIPAISRTYHMALERRRDEMASFTRKFDRLLMAVRERDIPLLEEVVKEYNQHNCELVLASLAEG